MNVFIVSIRNESNKKNRNMRIRKVFETFFCLRSNLSIDDHNFCLKGWSENGYGF